MTSTTPSASPTKGKHKRTTSKVLKSIVTTGSQKAAESGRILSSPTKSFTKRTASQSPNKGLPLPPPLNESNTGAPLLEIVNGHERLWSPPLKPINIFTEPESHPESRPGMLHKRTKSVVSLKNLNEKDKKTALKSKATDSSTEPKLKKSKSSKSLSAMLSKPKPIQCSPKKENSLPEEKENETPPSSSGGAPPPIWAQFTQQRATESTKITQVPLHDSWDMGKEMCFYTPQEYSPSKGRSFVDPPKLSNRPGSKPRPKSLVISPGLATPLTGALSKLAKASGSLEGKESQSRQDDGNKGGYLSGKPSKVLSSRSNDEAQRPTKDEAGLNVAKRGSRVMAAVAAWNGKSKEPLPEQKEVKEEPVNVESAFEKMLVRVPTCLEAILADDDRRTRGTLP